MAKFMAKAKKLIIPPSTPRNPLVTAAKLRRAGSHRSSQKAERQQASQALRKQLPKINPSSDDEGFCILGT